NHAVNSIVGEVLHETIEVAWKPPPMGWVKMNSDVSCKDNEIAGCGGLVRGSDDEWMRSFAKHIRSGSAYVVEPWGVLEGLKLARRLGFQAIEVNVDSLLVANTTNDNKEGSPMGRALVSKIRSLFALDWEVVVRHSYRKAN
ncbi:ribonuclease H protein, partial [Trifolium medium]|nr:ribonuclease H protein [Trifolium medium]